jgi:hypothetical protein
MTPLQTLQTEARAEYPKHCENSYCQWRTITLDELDSLTRRAYLLGVEESEKVWRDKMETFVRDMQSRGYNHASSLLSALQRLLSTKSL